MIELIQEKTLQVGITVGQGPKGEDGPQGPPGIQGPPGPQAEVSKEQIEAHLTGDISSHSHSIYQIKADPALEAVKFMYNKTTIVDNLVETMYELSEARGSAANTGDRIQDIEDKLSSHTTNHPSGDLADLSNYQTKNDNSLLTLSKSIVGAINENKSSFNGKSFRYLTRTEYEALSDSEKNNENIVYFITDSNTSSGSYDDTELRNTINSINNSLSNHISNHPSGSGYITSPDGTQWILKVSNSGVLSAEKVEVVIPVSSITLSKATSTLNKGDTEQLTVTFNPINATNKNILWTSSDNTKATVTNGLVTAVASGSVTITATSEDGNKVATCSYTLTNNVVPTDFVNYAYNTDTFTNPSTSTHPNKATYYLKSKVNLTVSGGVATISKTGIDSDITYLMSKISSGTGNVCYARALIKTDTSGVVAGHNNSTGSQTTLTGNGEWTLVSYVYNDSSTSFGWYVVKTEGLPTGTTVYMKELMLVNLTEIYGSGNEPDKATCDATFTTYKSGLVG